MDISNELVKEVITRGIQESKITNGKNIRLALDEKQNYCEVSLDKNGNVYFNFHDYVL